MSWQRKSLVGLFWTAVEQWGTHLLSLILFIVLARLLSPEAFGVVALAMAYVGIMQGILHMGLTQTLIQRPSLQEIELESALLGAFAISVILASLTWFAAPFIALILGDPGAESVLRVLALTFPLVGLGYVPDAWLVKHFEFRRLAIRRFGAVIAGGVVGLILAFQGAGPWALVARQLTELGVGLVWVWIACPWKPRRMRFSPTAYARLLRFGMGVFGMQMIESAMHRFDHVLVGWFWGTRALGYYTVARKVFSLVADVLITTIGRVLLPVFSHLQGDSPLLWRTFFRSLRAAALCVFPVFAGMALVADLALPLFFGESWTASARLVQGLALAGISETMIALMTPLLLARARPWLVMALRGFQVALILGAMALAGSSGLFAMTVAFTAGSLLGTLIYLVRFAREPGFRWGDFARGLRVIVPACILMGLGVYAMRAFFFAGWSPVAALVAAVGIGIVLYTAVILLAGRGLIREILVLREQFRAAPHPPDEGAGRHPVAESR